MRNILITAMMIVVVIVLFVGIINGDSGIKVRIQDQGDHASDQIRDALILHEM